MALPVTIASTAFATATDRTLGGPYISAAGNVYVVLLDSTDKSVMEVHKATDPTSSFSEVDSAHKPDMTNIAGCLSSVREGEVIQIATQEQTTYRVAYHTFDMVTDLWGVVNEQVKASVEADVSLDTPLDIGVRSNGDVIVLYPGDRSTVTMSQFNRVKYARRVSASWTIDVAVDNGGAVNWIPGSITRGSADRMHLTFTDRTNTDAYQRCLTAADALEAFPAAFDTSVIGGIVGSVGRGAAYESGGAVKIRMPYTDSTQLLSMAQCDSADAPTMSVSAGLSAASVKTLGGSYESLALAKVTTLYALWVNNTSADLYLDSNVDGAGWGTDVAEFAGTVNGFMANIFVRSGNWKLAYVVLDTTTVKYNELDLGAAFVWDGLVRSQAVSRSAVR